MSLAGYSTRGCRVRHDWATKHSTHTHLHMHTYVSNIHSNCQVVRTTWLRAEALDAHKRLPALGSEGHTSCWNCFKVFSQVESDAWEETANLPSKKVLGKGSRGLCPLWQVSEGPSGISDSKERFVTGAVVSVQVAEATAHGLAKGHSETPAEMVQMPHRPSISPEYPEGVTTGWPWSWSRQWGSSPSSSFKMYAHRSFPVEGSHFQGGSFERLGWCLDP